MGINIERDRSIDIAKGILIIMVVVGHSEVPFSKYLFWFHIPAFFILSGLFFRPARDLTEYKHQNYKQARNLLLPYVAFIILINVLPFFIFYKEGNWAKLQEYSYAIIYGGRKLYKVNGILWFIPVLFFTRQIISYLSLYLSKKKIFLITTVCLLLATIESYFIQQYPVDFPYNIDVLLASIFFYYLGHLLKENLREIQPSLLLLFSFIAIGIVVTDVAGFWDFHLDMKASRYPNILFMTSVPVVFTFLILKLSRTLNQLKMTSNLLTYIGKSSLVIMYLHLFANYILEFLVQKLYNSDFGIKANPLIFTVWGIVIPLIFEKFANHYPLTQKYFLGKSIVPEALINKTITPA